MYNQFYRMWRLSNAHNKRTLLTAAHIYKYYFAHWRSIVVRDGIMEHLR